MAKKIKPNKTLFYYMREEKHKTWHPRITVCLAWFISDAERGFRRIMCRGLSIHSCSEKTFNKAHSRGRALRRANEAFRKEADCRPIRRVEAWDTIRACAAPFTVKCSYAPMLTHFENRLVAKPSAE